MKKYINKLVYTLTCVSLYLADMRVCTSPLSITHSELGIKAENVRLPLFQNRNKFISSNNFYQNDGNLTKNSAFIKIDSGVRVDTDSVCVNSRCNSSNSFKISGKGKVKTEFDRRNEKFILSSEENNFNKVEQISKISNTSIRASTTGSSSSSPEAAWEYVENFGQSFAQKNNGLLGTSTRFNLQTRRENVSPYVAQQLYEDMLLGRGIEDACAQLYYKGKTAGFVHLYTGQEAVSTGIIKLLRKDDAISSTYRDHVHAASKGVPAFEIMSELFGKSSGCSKGFGGSMHMFSKPFNVYGGFAFIGEQIPIALGVAFSQAYKKFVNPTPNEDHDSVK